MKEPRLSNFNLTRERYEHITRTVDDWRAYFRYQLLIIACLGFIIGWLYEFERRPFGNMGIWDSILGLVGITVSALLYALAALFVGFLISSIGSWLIEAVMMLAWPDYRRVWQYDSATRAFEEWLERCRIQFWLSLSEHQFECELARLYKKQGYQVLVTGQSGDRGVDIWLYRGDETVIVQCKAHKKPVGPAVIRELIGTLQDSKATSAILASLSGFTKGVAEYTEMRAISLISLEGILEMQRKLDE
jgi:restriction system protein